MKAKATEAQRAALPNTDADIERFLTANHDAVAEQLAAGRAQVGRGEAVPLEPLDVLLRDARAAR